MTQCNPTRFSETRNKPTASQTLFYTFISGIYTYLPFVSCWKPLCFYVFWVFLPESSILTSSDKNHAVKILVEFIKHHKRLHRSRLGFSLVVTQNGPQFRRQRLGQGVAFPFLRVINFSFVFLYVILPLWFLFFLFSTTLHSVLCLSFFLSSLSCYVSGCAHWV